MESVIFHPLARRELLEATRWYENECHGLGQRFLAAVYEAVTRLQKLSQMGRRLDSTYRRVLVGGFPYGVIYVVEHHGLIVYAVMHLHREPNYWRDRG